MKIKELAKEAGFNFEHIYWTERDLAPLVIRFAELVAAHEREECIEAIQKLLSEVDGLPIQSAATKKFMVQIAHFVSEPMIEVIRARGKA